MIRRRPRSHRGALRSATENCEGSAVIVEPSTTPQSRTDGRTRIVRPTRVGWRRPRVLFIVLGVMLLAVLAVAIIRSQATPQPQTATQPAAPLIAHGQILPTRQARVGTQGGGVVQRLGTSPGDQVAAQTPLAWVAGPSGTELIIAPFDGTTTNVLVHAGDTLMPGAPIAVVADMHALQVETSDVDEFLVNKVSRGQRVQISVDALDNMALSGTVANVALLPQGGNGGGSAYPV